MKDEAWLNVVRLARDIGDISSLFPPGITRLIDLPYNIHNAILQALGFLSLEGLPKDERPPRRIWLDADAMEKHWKEVERLREHPQDKDAGMVKNSLKDRLLVGFD